MNDPQVLETAQYFDTVNCAARIKVPSLVAMGFIDTVTPPVGIWAAFNQIKAPKEAAPMIESPHNHLATPEQSMPWTQRSRRLAQRPGRGPVADRTAPTWPRRAPTRTRSWRTNNCSPSARPARSTCISWAIRSRGAGARATSSTRTCSRTGSANFTGWNAANFGWGADKTQHMLWRLQNGELDGVNPKIVVLMAGTNNVGRATPLGDAQARAAEVARGVTAVVREIRKRAPKATRGHHRHHAAQRQHRGHAHHQSRPTWTSPRLADGKSVRYVNINEQLAIPDNQLREGMANDGLHLTPKAYQVWADALKPIFTEILGPPATVDRAPPPTGDPSAETSRRAKSVT